MMSRGLVLVALLSMPAWADVIVPPPIPPDLSCVGRQAGDTCTNGGTCRSQRVRRPDFSKGVPPTWQWTELLVCEQPSSVARQAVSGLVLAMLAALLAWRRRRVGAAS